MRKMRRGLLVGMALVGLVLSTLAAPPDSRGETLPASAPMEQPPTPGEPVAEGGMAPAASPTAGGVPPGDAPAEGEAVPGEPPAEGGPAGAGAVFYPELTDPMLDPILTPEGKAFARNLRRFVLAKGIYVSGYTAANPGAMRRLMELVERTELNAMVIDIKDDVGRLTYASHHPEAQAAGAVWGGISDLPGLLKELTDRRIYTIARVVTFKDSLYAWYKPDLAVQDKAGGLWQDNNGQAWLNPYSREAWEYVVSIAREAARMGFDEIQFDYVRFPSDGPMERVVYPNRDHRTQDQVIAEFLAYARDELLPEKAWVSADIFGIVLTAGDGQGIGQHLETVAQGPDILSPMIYPSHYGPWNLGLANPNAAPYETIHRSLSRAQERLVAAGIRVRLRPWLQDFTLGLPTYGPAEVRAQIQAAEALGIREWLLWNPRNVYTEAALAPASRAAGANGAPAAGSGGQP